MFRLQIWEHSLRCGCVWGHPDRLHRANAFRHRPWPRQKCQDQLPHVAALRQVLGGTRIWCPRGLGSAGSGVGADFQPDSDRRRRRNFAVGRSDRSRDLGRRCQRQLAQVFEHNLSGKPSFLQTSKFQALNWFIEYTVWFWVKMCLSTIYLRCLINLVGKAFTISFIYFREALTKILRPAAASSRSAPPTMTAAKTERFTTGRNPRKFYLLNHM